MKGLIATVFSCSNGLCCEIRYLRTIINLFYQRHSFEKKSTKYVSGKNTAESVICKPSPG